MRGRRQGDIGYWGGEAGGLVALLLGVGDRGGSLASFASMALGAM